MVCDRQICPRGRYKGTGTIGQYKRQMKFAASMTPAKHIKRRSLKGMTRPNDGYLIGKVVEMMSAVVGSLSSSLWQRQPRLADPLPRAPHRRQAHHPPDP